MNNLYYMNFRHKDNIISDWFNMGNSMIMNIYSSVFLNLKYLNDTTGIYPQTNRQLVTLWDTSNGSMGPEYVLRDLMNLYKIRTIKMNGQCGLEKS